MWEWNSKWQLREQPHITSNIKNILVNAVWKEVALKVIALLDKENAKKPLRSDYLSSILWGDLSETESEFNVVSQKLLGKSIPVMRNSDDVKIEWHDGINKMLIWGYVQLKSSDSSCKWNYVLMYTIWSRSVELSLDSRWLYYCLNWIFRMTKPLIIDDFK